MEHVPRLQLEVVRLFNFHMQITHRKNVVACIELVIGPGVLERPSPLLPDHTNS
jgi:hypothetical protein